MEPQLAQTLTSVKSDEDYFSKARALATLREKNVPIKVLSEAWD